MGKEGAGHISEHWQSYWARRFAKQGYLTYDWIRWDIWEREDIAGWYRQNLLVFAKPGSEMQQNMDVIFPQITKFGKLDVMHPSVFAKLVSAKKKAAIDPRKTGGGLFGEPI